jgi:LacI family transcriptional regulator
MNIYDIARLAGVSRKTVQRVLNDSASVKPETKMKIRLIMEQNHYEPNETARKLSTKKTKMIGIFIIQDSRRYELHTDDLYFGAVIGGIINQCSYNGYKTMITILDLTEVEPLLSLYKQKSIDAGIIVSWSNVQEIVDRVTSAGFRIGVFDQNNVNTRPENVPIPFLDNHASAYKAANFLLDLGHTDLGIVTGNMDIPCSDERLHGFLQAAQERGIPISPSRIFFGNFIEQDGADAVEQWLGQRSLPKALFCSNDLMAFGALKKLRQCGISVPEDISVIGFDDLLISQYMQPALTSMRVPRVDMAESLTYDLLAMLEKDTHPAREHTSIFQAELIERESCKAANI